MIVIQHRAADVTGFTNKAEFAEIDVHINSIGDVVIKHDPDDVEWEIDHFFRVSKHKKFLIDIKQNLHIDYLEKIAEEFEGRSLGFFDVPFPSAFYARQQGFKIWARLSEFEPINYLFDHFWVDPLASWTGGKYLSLMAKADQNHKMMIASPELHGVERSQMLAVWETIQMVTSGDVEIRGEIVGMVTKYPKEAEEFFNA